MTPEQYQLCLHRLDLTQAEAGEFLGITMRTSCGYANGHSPVPEGVAKLLRLMVKLNLKPKDVK